MRTPEHMVCLVGSNPLPNYLAVKQFRPARVTLFHTPEIPGTGRDSSHEIAERLKRTMETHIQGVAVETHAMDKARAQEIRRNGRSQLKDAWLNYTGGTKAMAVHTFECWRELNQGSEMRAFYLNDGDGSWFLFSDSNEPEPMKPDLISFDEIFDLHGICQRPDRTEHPGGPHSHHAGELAEHVFSDPDPTSRTESLYKTFGTNAPDAQSMPQHLAQMGLSTDGQIPISTDARTQWCKFLKGEWLEYWCEDQLKRISDASLKVRVGNNLSYRDVSVEIDVLALRGPQLYLLSCTTDSKKKMCKLKAFEALIRARQIGGDHARVGFACFLDQKNANELYEELRQPLGTGAPAIFGLDALKEWKAGNHDALRHWLHS